MSKDFAAELIRRGKVSLSPEGEPDGAIDDVELRDGDSADIGREDDARFQGFNTGEKYHEGRTDEHPNVAAAQQLTQDVLDDGGYVDVGTERGAYGRFLSTVKDKHGRNIARDMVQSGAAAPTRSLESSQDEMTGIARAALGYDRTNNDAMNAVGQQNRDMNDEFKPWEDGVLEAEVYDRRGTFERAFDRGTDETKASLGGALNYIGEMLGNEEWTQEGRDIARKYGVDAALNKRKYESFDKVEGFEQAVDYVVETLGETAPGLIVDAVATAGTVGAGALTGGAGAAVGAGLMGAMRASAGRALMKGAKAGLYAGPAVSGFAQSAGAMENRLDESGDEDNSSASSTSGLVGAAANTLPFVAVLGRSLKASGVSDAALKPVTDALSKPSVAKRLKDVGVTTATGALAEGSTELAQTVIDEVIATEVGGDDWSLETKDAIDAGIRAVIGGSAMGGAASATGNTVGFMREYNKAREGADAEGQAVDSEGWLADEEVEQEQSFDADGNEYEPVGIDESLTQSIDRAAKRTFSKKAKKFEPKKKEDDEQPLEVVGQGQFDSLTAKDVPNLKSDRYKELKAKLEPKGVPVDLKTVGSLIDNGELTEAELASYAADTHYGRKTPVSGGYDSARGEEALRVAFERVVDLSRENKVKLTEAQRDKLEAAEDEGTDVAMRNALTSVSPDITNAVYKHANKFDGRAMFRDYSKIKKDKIKNRERLKKEAAPVEPMKQNATKPIIPEGEAPKEQTKKPVRDDAPEWLKAGREPTKEELAEGMNSLGKADKLLSTAVKNTIQKEGKKSPKARAVFAAAWAKNRKELAPIAKRYEFEGVGNFEADKRALVAKIRKTQHTPDGNPNVEDVEGLKSLSKQVLGEAKPKPRKRPESIEGKLEYIKGEIGTRDGSDGQVGQLIKAKGDYEKAKTRKDLVNPATLSAEHKAAIANKAKYEEQGNKAVVKAIEDLEDKIYGYELLKSYPKAVDQLFNEVENQVISRERGFKDELRHESAETDENGSERSIGDTQGEVISQLSDREIAANYTRRTAKVEDVYRALKGIKGIDQRNLLKVMADVVSPNDVESGTGLPLKRGRARGTKKEDLRGREYGLGLTGDITGSKERKPAFTHGLQEKQPDVRHLNARTVKRIKTLVDEGDESKVVEYLEQINLLEEGTMEVLGVSDPEERLHRIVRTSYTNSKRIREVTAKNRSKKGLVVRDNETATRRMVDMDAVTRWALRENDADFDTDQGREDFIKELSTAVLSGISALQNLKQKDGLSPAYSFDLNTIGDDVVVYRMSGDKLASVTMGAIRGSIHNKGRKRKASTSKTDPNLTDVAEGDFGNIYRDDVDLAEFVEYTQARVKDGELDQDQADMLIEQAEHSVFEREFEQADKEGGELTIKTSRVEDEFANRGEEALFGSRDAQHKLTKRNEKAKAETAKALDQDLSKAEGELEELKALDPLKALERDSNMVKEAADGVAKAEKAMSKALVEQVRHGNLKNFSKSDIRNAMSSVSEAPNDLLMAVAREHQKRNKLLFDDSPDLLAQLRSAQYQLKRAQKVEANVGSEADRAEALKKAHAYKVEAAERQVMAIREAKKRLAESRQGTDMTKGRKIQVQRKTVKIMQRRRGAVREPFYRLLEMTKTRLKRIHPEAAKRSDDYATKRRNDTEYFASRIGKDIGDAAVVQRGYEDSINGVNSEARAKYETFLKDLHRHVKKSDPTFEPVTAKVHLDLHKVERNREGFLSILREGKIENPEKMLESILEGNGYPEFAIRPELTNPPRGGRKVLDNMYEQLKAGGFADTDAPRHLIRLVNSSMSWAAWNTTHGGVVKGKWDSSTEFRRMESEVHPMNRQTYSKLYQGLTGRLDMDMSPRLRAFNSAMLAMQSATVLWFSGIASIPEVAAVYARMRGDTNGILGDARKMLSSRGRAEMVKVARDFDIITDDAIEHSLQEMYNMNDMSMGRISQKIQATVFKLNGQNYVTKMTRAVATKAAERYLVRAVENGENFKLAELGIEAKDVEAFSRNRDLNSKEGRKYRDAVHKFVNEAVTNPRSTQLPMVANDPRFLLVTTLKKFFYGFYENVHKALAKDFNDKRANGGNPLAAIAVTAAVAVPMALMAELIRETIRYPFGRSEWQGERDLFDWGANVLGATGALGPLTMAESVYRGTSYGSHPVVAAAGPTAQLAVDVATLEMQPSRVVPLANQIPWLANPINEGVKNLIN